MISARPRTPLIAIAGNPNTGKTTLFNRLTGARAKVANYPGVTVDCHQGSFELAGENVRVVDIPGCYSLSARSAEEEIALQAVCGLPPFEAPSLVVIVIDASQLRRNLYLVLQVLEMRVPVVVALNMVDQLEQSGQRIDDRALARELEVPVVPIVAKRGIGLPALHAAIQRVLEHPREGLPSPRWESTDSLLAIDLERIAESLPETWRVSDPERRRALALWALVSIDANDELATATVALRQTVESRRRLAQAAGRDLDLEIVAGRYGWIDARLPRLVAGSGGSMRFTERLDALLLHPVAGFAVFLALMFVVFQSLFSWSDPLISGIERSFAGLSSHAERLLPEGFLRDFAVGGLIAGVGSVLVFLPQILLLFLFLALMEDSGYMARVAFLMDRVMKAIGLHGRAFVPMMSGFACAIPAVLATRTMERRRDRLVTMMVIPLMTCAARLPVYTLIIGALFPPTSVFGFLPVQGLLMVGMYLFSTLVALVAAAVLSRTLLRGPKVPLILELPPYRMPNWRGVLRTMLEKGRVFVTEAGTVILVCTIALWALLSFPRRGPDAARFEERRAQVAAADEVERAAALEAIDMEERGARLRASYAGRLGHALEPLFAPLGFDWKICIGLIGSFAAREVFVATMGVVYGLGEKDEDSPTLRQRIRAEMRADGQAVYSPRVGLALMVFFALACQCISTLAVVRRETAGWRWPMFLFVYMTVLAWGAGWLVNQGGALLGL